MARRLMTVPGMGPLVATAIAVPAPPPETLRKVRDFAAWLGLVPRSATLIAFTSVALETLPVRHHSSRMELTQIESLADRTRGFLHGAYMTQQAPGPNPGLRLQARYDTARFSSDLFDVLSIPRPETLARAIDKRLAEFLAGRILAREAQIALNLCSAPVPIGEDRAPIWPADQAGSISHARGYCACILLSASQGRPGIDIETIAGGQGLESILSITVSTSEAMLLETAPDIGTAATLCFSAKETLFKALYPTVGRFFDFNCAELRSLPGPNCLTLTLTEDLHSTLPAGCAFDISYTAATDHVMTWLVHPA